jgi:hypothetical protein
MERVPRSRSTRQYEAQRRPIQRECTPFPWRQLLAKRFAGLLAFALDRKPKVEAER